MIAAENKSKAYRARAQSKNWADFARENPVMAEMLVEVENL